MSKNNSLTTTLSTQMDYKSEINASKISPLFSTPRPMQHCLTFLEKRTREPPLTCGNPAHVDVFARVVTRKIPVFPCMDL